MSRARWWLSVVAAVLSGCASLTLEQAVPPPQPAALASVPREVTVSVRGNPDVAVLRSVFERALARAGFRVLPEAPSDALTLNLSGTGAGTSGINEAGSTVHQSFTVDLTVMVDGRLKTELHTATHYVVTHARNDPKDSPQQYQQRVTDFNDRAFEWISHDLTNQLVAWINNGGAAAHP